MRILVTGASGHVGSAIVAHLLRAGIELVGLSRRRVNCMPEENQVQFDISSAGIADRIAQQVRRCEVIVHAAASLEKSLHAPSISLVNCLGTQEMLKLASLWQSNHFVYISSVPVIGRPQQQPVTELHPISPPTAYHASKIYGEYLVGLAKSDGITGTSLRLTSPIGPGMPPNRILPIFIQQAMSGKPIQLAGRGTRCQDYVDVRDIAMAVEKCVMARAGGLYNVASGRPVSNEELARMCVSLLESESPVEFTGRTDPEEGVVWEVSINQAREHFGYIPQFSLEDSIKDLAGEYADSHH